MRRGKEWREVSRFSDFVDAQALRRRYEAEGYAAPGKGRKQVTIKRCGEGRAFHGVRVRVFTEEEWATLQEGGEVVFDSPPQGYEDKREVDLWDLPAGE